MKAKTGCSAVRLAHLLWEQGVPGSNPGTPTKQKELTQLVSALFLYPKPNAIVDILCEIFLSVLSVSSTFLAEYGLPIKNMSINP